MDFKRKRNWKSQHLCSAPVCPIPSAAWLYYSLFGPLVLTLSLSKRLLNSFLKKHSLYSDNDQSFDVWICVQQVTYELMLFKVALKKKFINIFATSCLWNCLRAGLSDETQLRKKEREERFELQNNNNFTDCKQLSPQGPGTQGREKSQSKI